MQLNLKGLTLTAAVVWAGTLFIVGSVNLVEQTYGAGFLRVMASIYPGYDGISSLVQIVILVLYGMVDGALGGFLFGWIYNYFSRTGPVR